MLELRDFALCKIGIVCGGSLEVFLDSRSCLIIRFLQNCRTVSTPARKRWPWPTFIFMRGLITSFSKISTKACWVSTSVKPVGSRSPLRMYKRIPLFKLSLTVSHAALVVVGSARKSNDVSMVSALEWSFRKELALNKLGQIRDGFDVRMMTD